MRWGQEMVVGREEEVSKDDMCVNIQNRAGGRSTLAPALPPHVATARPRRPRPLVTAMTPLSPAATTAHHLGKILASERELNVRMSGFKEPQNARSRPPQHKSRPENAQHKLYPILTFT